MSEMTVKLQDERNEFLKCYLDEFGLQGRDLCHQKDKQVKPGNLQSKAAI
jgi:hypothetical protein